jgi:hypothetical protein
MPGYIIKILAKDLKHAHRFTGETFEKPGDFHHPQKNDGLF